MVADPELAMLVGGAALSTIAAIPGIDLVVPQAIEPYFPPTSQVDLDIGVAALSGMLTAHRVATEEDPAVRAVALLQHGTRLVYAGRNAEALATNIEATAVFRGVAGSRPELRPLLAGSLLNLATGTNTPVSSAMRGGAARRR